MTSYSHKSVITRSECSVMAERIEWKRFDNKTIGITGATGMLGSWITSAFLLAIQEKLLTNVKILGFTQSSNMSNLGDLAVTSGLEIVNTRDLQKFSSVDLDLLIHAASPASPHLFKNQTMVVNGNLELLQTILSSRRFLPDIIFLSTSEVYGNSSKSPIREEELGFIDLDTPRSIYPRVKLQTEAFIQDVSNAFGISFNIFRVFHTFGPGLRHDDVRSFSAFLWSISRGQAPRLHTAGAQVRSFLYALDFVLAVLNYPLSNSIVNVGSPNPVSIRQFAELVCSSGGLVEGPIFEKKRDLFVSSPNDFLVPNLEKLYRNGWSPTVDLESAITRTLHWMKSQ